MIPIHLYPSDPRSLCHRAVEIPPVFDKLHEQASQLGIKLQLNGAMTTELVLQDRMLDKCIHPWMYTYVTYAGHIGFCDHLIGRDDLTSGNILDKRFHEIWNSPAMVTFRADHLAKREGHKYFEHCAWCFRNRYGDFEHRIRPDLESILVNNQTVPSYNPASPAVRKTALS